MARSVRTPPVSPPVPRASPPVPGASSAIRLASDVGHDLTTLEPIARQIFGPGDRPPGWFARKLAREGVDPALSSLAFGTGNEVIGYLLVGHEPDPDEPAAPLLAHCAGLGVLPPHRGHGLGPALVARSLAALQRRHAHALHALAEPPRRTFYEQLGFHPLVARHTLQTTGLGPRDLDFSAHPPAAWELPGPCVSRWRAGTWSRTPKHLAATLHLERGTVHLSREGRAILVQRMCVDADERNAEPNDQETIAATLATLESLRHHFAATTPILVYGCNTVSCVTASLLRTARCRIVQTAWEMQRTLARSR